MMMTRKRYRKIMAARADLPAPEEFSSGGTLDLGVIGWGSTFGSVLDAVKTAAGRGWNVGALKITSIFPFHQDEISEFMARCAQVLIPELNFSGQLANLIGHLHRKDVIRLNMVTGSPFPPSAILSEIEKILQKGGQ